MSRMICSITVTLAVFATVLAMPQATAQTKLLRYPDLHGDQVVFVYGADLWIASTEGGPARRLTAHPGLELFPKFSPDGQSIAFTGQYDGDEQVYVIPVQGGEPRQLTYYPARGPLPARWGYDNQVYGWTPDGHAVLFRSMREGWTLTDTRLYTVSLDGGLPEPLPMVVSGGGDLSPEGDRVVFSPLTRDFRTWKRYQGGWAQDLFVLDLEGNRAIQVTNDPRTERDPMWIGDRIFFASDRNGTLNLYSYDLTNEELKTWTEGQLWDVRWPSKAEDDRIVFERAGELEVLDLADGSITELDIDVPDDGLARRPERITVEDQISDFALSPGAKRALFVSRGDIFTVPAKSGPTRNLTRTSGIHEKGARWSPDGRKIAYISDATGEEEIYLIDQDGSGEPEKLTSGGQAMRYAPSWSPDGQLLSFGDKDGKLSVLDVETKEVTEIVDSPGGLIGDATWSPKSGHIAFSMPEPSGFTSLYIWSRDDGEVRRITGSLFSEYEPVWDPEGNYLYYFSNRNYAPQIGSAEWNYVVNRATRIYALALRKDVKDPFPPESDEVEIAEESSEDPAQDDEEPKDADEEESQGDDDDSSDDAEDSDEGDDDAEEEDEDESTYLTIDYDGLAERVVTIPVPADNYNNLLAKKGHLLYVRGVPFVYGGAPAQPPAIHIFSMADREQTVLVEGAGGYSLAPDGSKIIVGQGGGFALYNATPQGKGSRAAINTSNMAYDRVPAQEWEQIFNEVWRRYRDFFYVENMHGYDWEALRDQYKYWLEDVAHRSDLNYVIGEMIAELNVGHAYIDGGDFETPDRPDVALPGCRFERDAEADLYRIVEILPGQNAETAYRSPLTEVGVDAQEGLYVLAIDGEPLRPLDNPYRLLRYKSDRPVTLTVNDEPTEEGAREITFRPRTSETNLYYLQMVNERRQRVDEATDGRIGYLHVPDMGAQGIQEFIKYFYGQIRKKGLIIDVRNNGGGNVSQMLINRLDRKLLGTRFSRTNDYVGTYPGTVFVGPMVCLINENSASDGDIFPARFKQAGLGPLIGKRTWGGVIGITNRGTLIDGGTVFVPEFGTNAVDGSWIIEGYGVDPDIPVDNGPADLIEGRDPQLERGIEEVLRLLDEYPIELPERPADPIKTKADDADN